MNSCVLNRIPNQKHLRLRSSTDLSETGFFKRNAKPVSKFCQKVIETLDMAVGECRLDRGRINVTSGFSNNSQLVDNGRKEEGARKEASEGCCCWKRRSRLSQSLDLTVDVSSPLFSSSYLYRFGGMYDKRILEGAARRLECQCWIGDLSALLA
jgi:hypothetical protein